MGRYGDLDYALWAKYGFLAGIALFVLGAAGNAVLSGPAWEGTALFDTEVLGILVGFVSVFGFGIFLPLTE